MWGAVKTPGTADPSGSDEMETREMILRMRAAVTLEVAKTGTWWVPETGVSHPQPCA